MHIGVLTSRFNLDIRHDLFSLTQTVHELKTRGHKLIHLDTEQSKLEKGKLSYPSWDDSEPLSAFICWMPPYDRHENFSSWHNEGGISYFDQIKWLGKRFPSPTPYKAVLTANDKTRMSKVFKNAGLAIPETWNGEKKKARSAILSELKATKDTIFVAKPSFGWGGNDVVRFSTPKEAKKLFKKFDKEDKPFILQRYVESSGTDYRAYVVGDRVVAGIQRKAKEGDWRGNAHQGALSSAFNFTEIQQRDAVIAMQSAGLLYGAVDLLIDEKTGQHYICEVNDCAGTDSIEKNHPGLNTSSLVADLLEQNYTI